MSHITSVVGAVTPVSSVEQSAASTPASVGRSEWVSLNTATAAAASENGAEESCPQDTMGK